MPMVESDYKTIRDQVRPGDVIAFGGDSLLSRAVRIAGGSNVSHVGVVLAAPVGQEPVLGESTVDVSLKNPTFNVTEGPLGPRYENYAGMAWWLPLSPAAQAVLDARRLVAFVKAMNGQPFDVLGGMLVVLRDLYQQVMGHESQRDFESYFCSELVARALEKGRVVPAIDASEVSPGDLCRWEIYEGTYHYLLKPGRPPQEIRGFNTRRPGST